MKTSSVASEKQLYVIYGDEKIFFQYLPRENNASQILIKVYPDCQIVVAAPKNAAKDDVLAATRKRARWIYKKLCQFDEQRSYVLPRKYISGESHYYLGRRYVLKVIENIQEKPYVKLWRGMLEINMPGKDTNKIQHLLFNWYKCKAHEIFTERLTSVLEKTFWVKCPPLIRISTMKKRWGSCSSKGRLTLNTYLIKAPKTCIDYVILHELCHIAEHNHNKRFYHLMNQVLPTWKKNKKQLDEIANKLLVHI